MKRPLFVVLLLFTIVFASRDLIMRDVSDVESFVTTTTTASSGEFCGILRCKELGQNCSLYNDGCHGNTFCGFAANASHTTCIPYVPVGANCSSRSYTIKCKNACYQGICQSDAWGDSLPGDDCTQDSDCYDSFEPNIAGPWFQCINNRCYGIPIGGNCNTSATEFGCLNSYCDQDTFKCTQLKLLGDACANDYECVGVSDCVNSTCVIDLPVVQAGGSCANNLACASGLYCGTNSFCYNISSVSYAVCLDSSDCNHGLSCRCDYKNGTGVCAPPFGSLTDFFALIGEFDRCYSTNKCNKYNYPDQCTACNEQLCASNIEQVKIFGDGSIYDPHFFPSCFVNDRDQSFSAAVAAIRSRYNCHLTPTTTSTSDAMMLSAFSIFVGAMVFSL